MNKRKYRFNPGDLIWSDHQIALVIHVGPLISKIRYGPVKKDDYSMILLRVYPDGTITIDDADRSHHSRTDYFNKAWVVIKNDSLVFEQITE